MREVRSDRGSLFLLCEKAKTDPSLKKYPPLPVTACHGYERSAKHEDVSRTLSGR